MVEVVSSLCFPKSDEYLKVMWGDFVGSCPVIVGGSFMEQDSLDEFESDIFDISYPVSLFLRLYLLDCECPGWLSC